MTTVTPAANSPTQPRKAKRVGIIGLAFIVSTGLGVVPILHGALLAALAVVASRALTLSQARKAIDINIVLLIGAAFGLGAAVQSSGLGQVIADLLLGGENKIKVMGASAQDFGDFNGTVVSFILTFENGNVCVNPVDSVTT